MRLCGFVRWLRLGVERLWSGARRTLSDTIPLMTLARLIQLLLVLMNLNLINDQALFERLGVQGSAMDFDCMYEEILPVDEEPVLQRWQHKAGKTKTWPVLL
jgi:hypothetical protein